MDFRATEETTDVAGLARDIVTKVATHEKLAALEAAGATIDTDLWQALADAGLLGLEADDAVGGAGLGVVENVAVAEELGRELALVPFGPHSVAALPTITAFGSSALQETWVGDLIGGAQVVSVAIDEELADDPAAPTTTARADGDGWVVDGSKVAVPFAASAAALIVNAATVDGVVAVLISTRSPGVTVTPTRTTGLVPTAQVDFDGVTVGPGDVLGAGEVVAFVADRMTLAQCAEQAGVVAKALDLTADYGREREQFGRPIGSFQAVAQRLADGYIDVRAAKLTLLQAAYLMGEKLPADTELATAKFWAADAGHRVAHTAVHVHGGVGIDTSHRLHRYFLRAKQNEFALGRECLSGGAGMSVTAAEPA